MYQQFLSRAEPGCIVFMLDRSESMRRPWAGSRMTMAEGVARALNKILIELCVKCIKESGGAPRDYVHIGIFGYGYRPSDRGQGVESALGGALRGRGIVPIQELARSPLALVEEPSTDPYRPGSRMPIWVEPVAGYQTPMCEAFETVGRLVHLWTKEHRTSFPPLIVNVTDGECSQLTYRGANLQTWAERVMSVSTTDGPALGVQRVRLTRREQTGDLAAVHPGGPPPPRARPFRNQ